MNWLDIVVIVVVLAFAFIGLRFGLIRAAAITAGLFVGVTLASRHDGWLGQGSCASIVAFIFIVVLVVIVAGIIGHVLQRILRLIMLGWVDRLAGLVLGTFFGVIFFSAILSAMAKAGVATDAISHSYLAELFVKRFPLLLGLLPENFDFLKSFFK
jgi:membrane protein required for colicin V production